MAINNFTPVSPSNVTNGEFEDPTSGDAWLPNGWTYLDVNNYWAYAAFEGLDIGGVETFDSLWDDNEDSIDEFEIGVNLQLGEFADGEEYESFENGWESNYLDPGVQTSLGTNENITIEMNPSIGVFLSGLEYEDFETGWIYRHKDLDPDVLDNVSLADFTQCYAAANLLKSIANAHFPSTFYHLVADSRTISSPDATDPTSLYNLTNELMDDTRAHTLDTGEVWHRWATDNLDVPGQPPLAVDLPTAQARLGNIISGFGRHLWWRGTDYLFDAFNDVVLAGPWDSRRAYNRIGLFDTATADQPVEDFEEGWRDNEDWIAEFEIGVTLVLFQTLPSSNTYESFDENRQFTGVPAIAGQASNELTMVPHSTESAAKPVFFFATGIFNGTYKLQGQKLQGGTWIDLYEFVQGTIEYETLGGYKSLRIYCVAGGGTPSCYVGWERQDIF